MDTKERNITGSYWRMVYKQSQKDIKELFALKVDAIKLFIGIVFSVAFLMYAVYLGFVEGFEDAGDIILGLFLSEIVLIFILWTSAPIVAFFNMPSVAAQIDNNKTIQIKTLSIEERPEIAKLAILRTKGVQARNHGIKIQDEQELQKWIEEYTKWVKSVKRQLKKISPGEAEYFQTLDRYSPTIAYSNELNSEHRKHLMIYDERLIRLAHIIERYLGHT